MGKVWTEAEVRSRLRRYNNDDSLYDARIARPSQVCIAHTSVSDPMSRAVYRLLKRVDLDRAIEGALWPVGGRARTAEQRKRLKLYYVIRTLYVYEMQFSTLAILMNIDSRTVRRYEEEAVGLITGYLNMRLAQSKPNIDARLS